jgi:HEPN domain-containing protein
MLHSESNYPSDWFRIGQRDLDRARRLLAFDDAEAAAFYCQQAVEKYLKGYLLARSWRLRRIHDLEALLNDAVKRDPGFEQFRESCRKMTQYYIEDRYPFTVPSKLTKDEVAESLAAAEAVIARITGMAI